MNENNNTWASREIRANKTIVIRLHEEPEDVERTWVMRQEDGGTSGIPRRTDDLVMTNISAIRTLDLDDASMGAK